MICVTVACERLEDMLAQRNRLAAEGAELVELRLDFLPVGAEVTRLLADRPTRILATCRPPRDGGKFQGDQSQRLAILRAAVTAGADYVDLEEDAVAAIPRAGSCRRIVSHHDFNQTPDDLDAIHRRLSQLDADMIKICTMAIRPRDNLRMLRLGARSKIPTVAFCMGDIGTPSRLLAGRFGAPFTYAAPDRSPAVAAGQLPFQDLKELYRYNQINAATDVYGVIADPVGHSLSPLIHNTAFRELGLNKVYLPFRIPPADLIDFLDDAPHLGVKGLSVTIPHKEAILPKLAQAEEAVRDIGACNTAVFDGQNWSGYNTDCQAAMESLEDSLGTALSAQGPLAGKNVLVLGSGGAGKAIAYGLVRRKANVVLTDGMSDRAVDLAKRLGCQSIEWAQRHTVSADVVVNCTPLGMHPKVDETPLDAEYLHESMVVFDAVYNPEHTRLLRDARQRGCKVVSGVNMFVRQACLQFRLFTGHEGPAQLMRQVIKKATAAARR